ncbi:unnamed protein product, partial [Mesorhabditis spiculigera]
MLLDEAIPLNPISPICQSEINIQSSTGNEYLNPDSVLQSRRQQEDPLQRIQQNNARCLIWQKNNLLLTPFYKLEADPTYKRTENEKLIREYLNDSTAEEVCRLLHNVREQITSTNQTISIPHKMAPFPRSTKVTYHEIISHLDWPFISWLEGDIEEPELLLRYELQNHAPRPEKTRCPLWIFVLPAIILLLISLITGFWYVCQERHCFAWLQNGPTAWPYREKRIELSGDREYFFKNNENGFVVFAKNTTDSTSENDENLAYSFEMDEYELPTREESQILATNSKLRFNDCTLNPYNGERKTNCYLFNVNDANKSRTPITGLFLGDKSMHKEKPHYLLKDGKDYKVVKVGKRQNHELLGELKLRENIELVDMVVDDIGNGVVLVKEAVKGFQLCNLTLAAKLYVKGECAPVGQIPCHANQCRYVMKRFWASYYLFISQPVTPGILTLSVYDRQQQKLLPKTMATTLHSTNPLFRTENNGLQLCFIDAGTLVCRASTNDWGQMAVG